MLCRSEDEADALINALLMYRIEDDMAYLFRCDGGQEKLVKQITVVEGKLEVWRRR